MQKFRDLPAFQKLMLAFGLLALIVCGVGTVSITSMQGVQSSYTELYERHALGLAELKEAHRNLVVSSRAVRDIVLTREPAALEAQGKIRDQAEAKFQQHFAAYRKTIILARSQETASQAVQQAQTIFAFQARVIRDVGQSSPAQIRDLLNTCRQETEKLDQLLVGMADTKVELMQARANDAQQQAQTSFWVMIGSVIGAMTLAMTMGWFLGQMFGTALNEAAVVMDALAAGDLTKSLEVRGKDEMGRMARSINVAVEKMRQSWTGVRSASDMIAVASRELSAAADQMASGAQEQASSLEETAASLEQITSTVRQNADNARQANQLASGSRDLASRSGEAATSAVGAMKDIDHASRKISDIITTIDEIAFQTNLLALNAAVEAARAGEQGRGFAVVATEVRNLAQRCGVAAKEIRGLIQDSSNKVQHGSDLVNRSGSTLEEVVNSVKRVGDIVAEISAASQEQALGIEQVNKAMTQMDQVTQSNAAQTEELSSTAKSLSDRAADLKSLVAKFRLLEESGEPGSADGLSHLAQAVSRHRGTAPAKPTAAYASRAGQPSHRATVGAGTRTSAGGRGPAAEDGIRAMDAEFEQF